jgi:hypothetical protein
MSLDLRGKAGLVHSPRPQTGRAWIKALQADRLLLAGLCLIGLLSRLPFRTQALYHWDSVNFALAMDQFDINLHQPHPPGYILYVLSGRLVNAFVGDPNASLVWISLVSGSLLVPAIAIAGRALFNRRVGLWAAVLALASPLVWFHGEIALSYATEALLVTLLAVLFYRSSRGDGRALLPTALGLALAGGLRQNTVLFLTPLWLVALTVFARKTGRWSQAGLALTVWVMACLAWLLPMVAATGGLGEYVRVVRSESAGIAAESSLLEPTQLAINGGRLVMFTLYTLGPGLLALLGGALWLLTSWRERWRDRRVWLFALWIAPALLFYSIVHIRQPGHTFTFMPALILLTAAALDAFYQFRPLRVTVLLNATIVFNVSFFLLSPPALFGSNRLLFSTPGRRSLNQQDDFIARRVEAIRDHFDPVTTAVIASDRYYRHPDFYLADYQQVGLSHRVEDAVQTIGEPVTALILFNDEVVSRVAAPLEVRRLSLPSAAPLAYLELAPGERLLLDQETIRLHQNE